MGKANQGVFGSFRGKVGNVVGRVLQGQQVYAIYQPSVANPQTPAQIAQRAKFKKASEFFSSINSALRVGFANLDGYDKGNPYSAALGYNLTKTNAITYMAGVADVKLNQVVISQGIVGKPYNCAFSVTANDVDVTWTDTSGISGDLSTDMLSVLIYHEDSGQSVFEPRMWARNARTASISFPSTWTTGNIHCWAFMSRGNLSSPQFYQSFPL